MTQTKKERLRKQWIADGDMPPEICCEVYGFPQITEEEASDIEYALSDPNRRGGPIYIDICNCQQERGKDD